MNRLNRKKKVAKHHSEKLYVAYITLYLVAIIIGRPYTGLLEVN